MVCLPGTSPPLGRYATEGTTVYWSRSFATDQLIGVAMQQTFQYWILLTMNGMHRKRNQNDEEFRFYSHTPIFFIAQHVKQYPANFGEPASVFRNSGEFAEAASR